MGTEWVLMRQRSVVEVVEVVVMVVNCPIKKKKVVWVVTFAWTSLGQATPCETELLTNSARSQGNITLLHFSLIAFVVLAHYLDFLFH